MRERRAPAPHSSLNPATIGSRSTRRATTRGREHGQREQAAGDERDLAGGRRQRQRRRSPRPAAPRAARARTVRAATPAIAAGTATAIAAPASTRPTVGASAPHGAQQRDGAAALAGGHGERLDQRVEAHEADGEPDAAQHRGEHGQERGVVGLGRADPAAARRRGRRAGASPPRGRRRRAAGRRPAAAGPGRAASSRSGRTQPIRPSCSSARTIPTTRKRTSPPSGICAASTEPGRRPSASASPTPTSISPGPRIRRPSASGGASNSRVVAGVGDQPHRLAEPERVGGVDAVALADGGHAGQPLRLVDERTGRARPRSGSACRSSPGPRAAARAARPARASASRRRRRPRSSPPPRASARGPRWRSATPSANRPPRAPRARARGRGRRRAGSRPAGGARRATPARWRRRRRPRRRRPARARSGPASAAPGPSSFSAASSSAAGRATISAPSAIPSAAAGHRHERRLGRLLGRDPARAEAERALHAEAGQPALDVGVRARGEHRPGRDQRHERERDQQRDHDPRGLREQDLDARAGDELQPPDAERRPSAPGSASRRPSPGR